jgi:hypothetical protein
MSDHKKLIYCDENGNTGERLLDAEQPFFVLASNDYSKGEAEELVRGLLSQGAAEAKFKTLKKTPSGRARLAQLLVDPRFNAARIAAFVIDKRFMVFTKLVDIVMETLLHEARGVDLYKSGANLATANMMHYVVPAFCGQSTTIEMLEAFVQLVRRRAPKDIDRYVAAGLALVEACSDREMKDFLRPFFSRQLLPRWLPSQPENALDPAIPSLFKLIDTWGRRKLDRFTVVHDRSKPIIASEELFKRMMAEANEGSRLIGYDRRKFLFPLLADGLLHEDSALFPQLQLADVCAGALSHYLRCKREGIKDEICEVMDATDALSWVVDAMCPSPAVTPQDLGTEDESGTNPLDPFVARERCE